MMSLPARASAFTSASTTKAFSVPSAPARRLISGISSPEKSLLCRSMLVNCVAYQDGKKLADVAKHEIHDYLARPGCFVWVALKDAAEAELEEMREQFGLHHLAVEDPRHGHQRPKIDEYDDQ